MREHDACGIGFVADAQGRASRAIVADALHGLACVKHRGAAAADGLTSDGCGVLTPIPPALFGEGNGVIALFVRGADAKTLVEDACAAEGVKVLDWRKPETDDTVLGHMAAETRPEILQAIIGPPTDSPYSGEVTAYRIRRHLAAIDGLYVVVLLVPHGRLQEPGRRRPPGRLLPGPRRRPVRGRLHDLPPAVLHQHAPHLGAGPALPHRCATTARSTPSRATGTACWPARSWAPRRPGLGPESLFRPVLDDQTSDSGKLDEALELLTRGRSRRAPRPGHARARGLGARRRPRPRGARLLPLPLGAHGALGRPGRPRVHRRRRGRRGPRPQRPPSPALRHLRGRPGRLLLRGRRRGRQRPRQGRAGPARPRPDALRRPDPGRPAQRGREGAARRRRHLRPLGPRRLPDLRAGRAGHGGAGPRGHRGPPGHPRVHPGGAGHGAAAHGGRREGAHLLHGRRLAAAPDGRSAPPAAPLPASSASPRSPTRPSTRCASTGSCRCAPCSAPGPRS